MTFDEWLRLSDDQRREVASKWNPYAGEGEEIVAAAAERFGQRFASDAGVKVRHGVYHGGDWTIGVTVPFVFDDGSGNSAAPRSGKSAVSRKGGDA